MRILTAVEMREVDRRAIEEIGVPGMVLMENAAIGVVDALARSWPQARSVAVLCGPGNNGGDGLAVARQLETRGYRVRCRLAGRPGGDAAAQLAICRALGVEIVAVDDPARDDLAGFFEGADLAVDALFGTGLTRPLEGGWAAWVERLNEASIPCVAVDLPSGLDASRPAPIGPCVRAALTVSFAAPKIAHIFPPAADAVGRLVVADLGIPPRLVEAAPGDLRLLEGRELAAALAPRPAAAHKGDLGHVLLIAGSEGKSGAAVLAARGAVRSGAGLVTAAVPAPIVPGVDAGSVESMTAALPVSGNGALGAAALEEALRQARGKSAIAMGPGLGLDPETVATVRGIVRRSEGPLVLDADAINAFGGDPEALAEAAGSRDGETVITPHPGELARLLGAGVGDVQADRPGAARDTARRCGVVTVLKGARTVVADPRGGVAVNPTGNPGMATGGSGDVLTGMIAGLAGQGYDAVLAAEIAVFLHGLAGDLAAEERTEACLAAADLLDFLPAAWRRLTGE